jgi:hypothetical protein
MVNENQINDVLYDLKENNQNKNIVNNSDNMEFDFSLCFDYYYSYCLC